MPKPFDPIHRWRSLVCLAVAAGMLHWGEMVFRPMLRGWLGVVYWGTCLTLALFTLTFGMRDIRSVRQSFRLERVALIRGAYRDLIRIRRGFSYQGRTGLAAASSEDNPTGVKDPV